MFRDELARHVPPLTAQPEYQLDWSAVTLPSNGPPVPADLVDQVRQAGGLPERLSVLDPQLARILAASFSSHPWVASVERVDLSESARIRIDLTYRRPVLMVLTGRGLYPVDAEGCLLPSQDFQADEIDLYPRLQYAGGDPSVPAGAPWGDPTVTGAAALAGLLTRAETGGVPWQKFGLRDIWILAAERSPANDDAVIFGLSTAGDSQIVWGHAPGADALEPTAAQKLLKIAQFVEKYGPFAELTVPVRIDIRPWDVIHWETLARNPHDTSQAR
jgi:hypothetical protein